MMSSDALETSAMLRELAANIDHGKLININRRSINLGDDNIVLILAVKVVKGDE